MGEDEKFIDRVLDATRVGENITSDPVTDWFRLIACKEIYGAFSSFTLSAMLFDPNKRYVVLDQKSNNGPVKLDSFYYDCVQELFNNLFTNAYWFNIVNREFKTERLAS